MLLGLLHPRYQVGGIYRVRLLVMLHLVKLIEHTLGRIHVDFEGSRYIPV